MPDHDATSPRGAGGPRLSRRGVLQAGGVALGGLGASALVGYATGGHSPLFPAPISLAAAADPSAVPAREPSPMDFAVLPPARPHQAKPVDFALTGYDGPNQTILIAPGRPYVSMNFDGQVPAPTLRVTEGDVVRFTLHNAGAFQHSIDFHAAQTSWSANYQSIDPGASFTFEWTAHHPGAFMYHCGTPPVIMHIADGMYGAVIVDPAEGRPAAREYVIVQSEFYGAGGDVNAMLNAPPDVVCFNGQALRYQANPLPAAVGEVVRLFVVNAGPNSTSAFHVIGALFDRYEPEGNPANAVGMHQTINVPPGDGAMVELTFDAPGQYPFVTHRFSDASKGALGLFDVTA